MTSNTPTPARPALDEGDEPSPEAILIAAWKLRFDKAFRPEEEAGALMAFLDTIGLCVVSKRSLADMRGALQQIKQQPVLKRVVSDGTMRASDHEVLSAYHVLRIVDEALARSAP